MFHCFDYRIEKKNVANESAHVYTWLLKSVNSYKHTSLMLRFPQPV